jgi:hypothetical protein
VEEGTGEMDLIAEGRSLTEDEFLSEKSTLETWRGAFILKK